MGNIYTKGMRKFSSIGGNETLEKILDKELDDQMDHYKPESLDKIMEETHFNKNELKYLYQCFKQTCPNGYVNRQQFCQIYRSFFAISPKTDAKPYANMIFDTLDDDGNGRISFSEFANELSMFIKGDVEKRIDWIFDLYDSKRRGYLMEEDFLRVFRAMYSLIGIHYLKDKHIPVQDKRIIKRQFKALDKEGHGKISRRDFIESCLVDKNFNACLVNLKTVW